MCSPLSSVAQACQTHTVIPACFLFAESMIPLAVGAIVAWHTVAFVVRRRWIGAEAYALVLAWTEYVTGGTGYVACGAHGGAIEAWVGNEMFGRVQKRSDGSEP